MFIDWVHNHPSFSISIGTLMIAMGGLIATLGWEGRSGYTARRAMLEVLSAEIQINAALLGHSVFKETNPERLKVVRVIPAFNDSALRAAMSSGSFTGKGDQNLLDAVVALDNSIIYFRQFTEVYHGLLIKASNFTNEEQRNREFSKLWLGLREAASLAQVKSNIATLQKILKNIEPEIKARPSWLVKDEATLPQANTDGM